MRKGKEKGDADSEPYLRSSLTQHFIIAPQNQILRLNQWFRKYKIIVAQKAEIHQGRGRGIMGENFRRDI